MKQSRMQMPVNETRIPRRARIVLIAGVLLWCGLIAGAPLIAEHSPGTAALIRLFFAPVCHQQADRCFRVADRPLAVCARCTGIYAGFLTGVLLLPALRKKHRAPNRRIFLLAAAPTAAEFSLARFHLIPDSAVVRAGTGLIIGAVVAACVIGGWSEIVNARKP